jgi:2'-5' RNA ligase
MALAGTGCFPNARRPAVLWIGATEGAASLVRLAEAVDGALGALGFEREKRAYSAHLTIGRVRSPRNVSAVVDAMALAGFADGPFRIDAVHLMKSDLLRTGAVYTTLRTFKLQG